MFQIIAKFYCVVSMLALLLTGCGVAQAEPLPYVDLSQREPLPAVAPAIN